MKRLIAALTLIVGLPMAWALADFAGTAGSGLTFFSFACFTTKICTAQVPISSAGVEIVPATAALQTTANTKLDTLIAGVTVSNTNANGQATMANSSPVVIASNQASIPVAATLGAETTKNIGTVSQLPYPSGATPITASATGTTAATTATLAGTSGKTTYICGYSIRANATAATTVTNTITGVITATLSSIMWIAPAASGLGVDEQIFSPCIPASGTNQAIAIVSGAPGTGGLVSSKGWGYQL